ncbi:MAG: DUF305 domain-containing protein [Xanthobacteraceae bacterium]
MTAVAGLALASAAAFAHAQSQNSGEGRQEHAQMQGGYGMMHGSMHPQDMGQGMGNMQGPGHGASAGQSTPKGDAGPSSLAFQGINKKMHESMDIAFTGNADVDFVRGMIPHHQGAIDMAKTVLAFGKDPETKKLAEEIIKAQEGEIAWMKEWLKKNAR